MIRRPPRSTQSRSSAASDVYKRQVLAPVPPPTGMVPRAIEVLAAAVMVWSAGRTVRADGMGVLVAVGIATTEVLVAPTCAVGTMGAAVGGMVAVGRIAASTVC